MSQRKPGMPSAEMRKGLTEAMKKMKPQVVSVLATADPAYLDVRAAEAFANGDRETALVLVAWSLAKNAAKTSPG